MSEPADEGRAALFLVQCLIAVLHETKRIDGDGLLSLLRRLEDRPAEPSVRAERRLARSIAESVIEGAPGY